MSEKSVIIKLDRVTAGYGGKVVLRDVSLQVYRNDFLGIIGPNGGGKTTLIKVILGLLGTKGGTVDYYDGNGNRTKNLKIGYLPQYTNIDRHFPISVHDVVLSGLNSQKRFMHPFGKADKEKAEAAISEFGISDYAEKSIGQLSGGQLQRALLARATVSDPDVLILDEPNTYIDQRFQEQLYKMLEKINRNCAIIVVSHDIGTILQSVQNIACVNHDLHYHPAEEVTMQKMEKYFGGHIDLIGHYGMPRRILKGHDS